jgi:hypothetical protein
MALFYEPTDQCAQKVLDGADIVRDAMFRQQQRRKRPGLRVSSYDSGF